MSSTEKIWIIKCNNQILGPFTIEGVNDLIRGRQIVALDEITKIFGRWSYLRDQETFKDVLYQVQRAEHSATDLGLQKEEDTQWDASDNIKNKISREGVQSKGQEFQKEEGWGKNVLKKKYVYGPLYGPRHIPRRKSARGVRVWMLMSLLLVLVAILFNRHYLNKNPSSFDPEQFQSVVEKGLKAKQIGDLLRARQFFIQANKMKPDQIQIVLHLAPLLINDYQTAQAEKLLERQLESEFRSDLRKQVHNLIALSAIKELKYNKANKNLEEALKIDNNYIPALFNRAVVSYYLNNYSSTYDDILKVLELSKFVDGSFILLLSESAIQRSKEETDTSYIKRAEEILENYLLSGTSYIQEIYMMRAYISYIKDDLDKAQEYLKSMLDSDPMLTQEHIQNLILFRGRAEWKHLFKMFEYMYEDLEKTPYLVAAYGLLSFWGRGKAEGREVVEKIVRQVPGDSLIQGIYSYVKFTLGRLDEARATMKMALENNIEYRLPLILEGRYCMRDRDFFCAKEAWKSLLKIEPKNISAIAGLARVHFEEGDFKEAERRLSEGLKLSDRYKPLLELQAIVKGVD